MENLYTPSELLTREEFDLMSEALHNSWQVDTTHPDYVAEYSDDNRAPGQCAPTAIIVCDLFGGRMIYDKDNFHVWNELPDGTQQDLTRSQFEDERTFSVYKYQTRSEVLTSDNAKRTKLEDRYNLLKQRFLAEYARLTGS